MQHRIQVPRRPQESIVVGHNEHSVVLSFVGRETTATLWLPESVARELADALHYHASLIAPHNPPSPPQTSLRYTETQGPIS